MRLLVGAGTPKEAVARGWGFFLAQSPGDGASNTAILLFWTTSASDLARYRMHHHGKSRNRLNHPFVNGLS